MNMIKPELVFIILLLVIPGFISQSIFNSLVERGKEKHVDVYQYVLHSIIVYIFLYPVVILYYKVDPKNIFNLIISTSTGPLISVLIIALVSIIWGLFYSKVYGGKAFRWFFGRFINTRYEPPNLYASLLVDKYKDKDQQGNSYWVIIKDGDGFIEGRVELVSVERSPREIYITGVNYLDREREVIRELPENTGLILNVDNLDIVEIAEVRQNQDGTE